MAYSPNAVDGRTERYIDQVPILKDTSTVGPYFEVLILNDSGYPPGGTPKGVCVGCGRQQIDSSARELRMTPDMWQGQNIFLLATTLYVVITNELREHLTRERPTNVIFEEI